MVWQTAADWMSTASFISPAGIIVSKEVDGGAYLMGWTGGYVTSYVISTLFKKIW